MRAVFASGGYVGCTLRIRLPSVTPCDTRIRCGAATFGRLAVEPIMPPITPLSAPPGTPPATPPIIPVEGGASSSLIIFTFSGILVGVRRAPFSISVSILVTFTTAAGGGGGGGGGGATKKVVIICEGSASV